MCLMTKLLAGRKPVSLAAVAGADAAACVKC